MKRVLSLFLSCIFVLGVCFSTPIVASAAGETTIKVGSESGVINGCTYVVTDLENKYCALKSYTDVPDGESVYQTVLSISGGVDFDEENYTITSIQENAFNGVKHLETLSIDSNITAVPNAGSSIETINYTTSEDKKITFSGLNAIYTGETQGVTINGDIASITYDNKETTDEEKAENVSAVGSYTATVSLSESEVLTFDFTIDYLPTPENAVAISGGFANDGKYWFNGNESITVTSADGYYIAKVGSNSFESSVTFSSPDVDMKVQLKNSEGQITDVVTLDNIGFDVDEPTGIITLDENNSWDSSLLETITFGLFFKTEKNVTIEANDAGSGVKSVEYYISTDTMNLERLIALDESSWQSLDLDGDKTVALTQNSKNIVYARITDNVGNVKYISSNGIVLYSDSTADTGTIEFTYKSADDKDVFVTLNGNEINSITCDKGEFGVSDYTVDSNKITLKGGYLKTLAADEYTYTVSYNPLGVDFVSGTNNNEPATTTFKVIVNKADITGATLPEAKSGLVYDGTAQALVEAGTATGGTMMYSLTPNDENSWSESIPTEINAGTYTVYYKVKGDSNHSDSDVASVVVTIGKVPVTLSVETQERVYDGTTAVEIKSATVSGVVNDEKVTVNFGGVTATSAGSVVGTHEVDFAGKFVLDGETASNYEITTWTQTFVDISKKAITITASNATTVVNSDMPEFEYTVEGLVDGDSITEVTLTPSVENTGTVGDYDITVSNAVIKNGELNVTSNYEIEYVKGTLSVVLCEKHSWKEGVCEVCETACEHTTWEDGKCEVCKIACEHEGGTATCYAKAVCEICGTSYGETTAHDMTGIKIETYPTCAKEGTLKYYCKNDGCTHFVTDSIEIDAEKHDWVNGTREETIKPTCKTEGVITITCANGCGKTTTELKPVVADAHVLGEWVETPATCVKAGEKVRACTEKDCTYKETEVIEINKDAHDMTGEWEVLKEVTCVTDGEKELKCKNEGCTHKVTEVVKADGESHNLSGLRITIEPKCTVAGEIAKLCQNEGCSYKEASPLEPDGTTHDPAEEFTVVPATCISAGEKYKKCQNPDCTAKLESEELPLDVESHVNTEIINLKEPTCLEEGYTGDTFCKDCKKTIASGVVVDATGHTASEWIVDKEATFEEEGAQHKECTVCKEELQKAVIEKRSLDTPVVKIENAGNGIKVTWSQDEDAAGYTVYRSTYDAKTKKWSKWVNRGTADATKSSWVDKKVEHGVTYKFTVRAINDKYKSAYKETDALLYIVAPKVTCSITSTGIIVNWNKIDNADSYDVYRSVLVDGAWVKWTKIGSTKAEKNTFLDDKVESGVNYKYTVRVVDGKVKSGYVSSASIIYLGQPVLKIKNSANGVTGNWEKIEGATGYTIYRSEYNPSIKKWTKWLNLGTTKATAKSFTDKTVKSGYKYKYTIRAINGKLKSTYEDSNQLIFLTQPTLTIANTASGIQGKWNKVDGATGYILYRSELKEDGSWTKWLTLGTAKATAKSFTDKTVKSGVQYKYTIRAKNGNYKSSYIDSNTSIFLGIPTVKIANAETGVKVSWGKIEGAKNYLVYRSEYNSSTKKWSGWKIHETVDTTSFVDETAVSNVKYKYTVRALNGDYRSYYKASTELLYLKAPTVTAEKIDEGIKVSWTKIEGATSYIIYRSELSEDGKWSKWTKLGTAGEKYTSCKDKTVKENVTYKYTVRAVNGKIMSSYVASEQILNGVVTETTPEEPKTDVVA